MSRTSNNLDLKLLKVGKKLLIKKGASGLNIRELTGLAGVNLGMFSYYFKNKDSFIDRILGDLHEELVESLNHEKYQAQDPLVQLENQLLIMAYFARDNRELITSLLKDILDEHKVIQRFIKMSFKKHFLLLRNTLQVAQKEKLIIEAPMFFLLTHVVGGIGVTNLAPVILRRAGINKVLKFALSSEVKKIENDDALKLRVKIVINGIKAENSKKDIV